MIVRAAVLIIFPLAFAPAAWANLTFVANLTGGQVAPIPVSTTAIGYFSAFHDLNGVFDVDLSFSGLTSPTTNAMIHCCGTEATTAMSAIDLGDFGFPVGVTSGTFSHQFDMNDINVYEPAFAQETIDLVPLATATDMDYRLAQSMIPNFDPIGTGTAYLTIYTQAYPNGELRGNISVIPEPASLLLLLCGVAGLCGLRRRR